MKMTSNKILISLVVIVLLIVGALSLSGNRATSDVIVIGSSLPLTGPSASLGERVKQGMDLALDEVNAGSGKKFLIVYEDDKGDSKTTVSTITKLIETDGVQEIVGLLKSDPLLAAAPVLNQHQVVLLSPTAGAAAITTAGDFIFRNIEGPDAHGKADAAFFLGRGLTKTAVFSAKASNALSYADAFQTGYTQSGGALVYRAEYATDATDFRTEIAEAKSKGAQAFFIGTATAKDAGLVVKQARELEFKGTVLASVAAEAKELIDTAGAAAEGAFISSIPFDATTAEGQTFAQKYSAKYDQNADGFSANGYDAVHLIVSAITACKDAANTTCVRNFLYATKGYKGAGGLTSFDNNGDVTKTPQIKVVRDGQFIKYSGD